LTDSPRCQSSPVDGALFGYRARFSVTGPGFGMRGRHALARLLTDIDGRGYGSYQRLRGTYDLGLCRLVIDHVQADPYAPPSKVRTVLDRATAALPDDLAATPLKRVAVSDFLTRRCHEAASPVQGAGRRGPTTTRPPGPPV